MIKINDDDLLYALKEMSKSYIVELGQLEYEDDLIRNSPEFWVLLIDTMRKIGERKDLYQDMEDTEKLFMEMHCIRTVLIFIFASVYSACGEIMPQIRLDSDTIYLGLAADKMGRFEHDVFKQMQKVSKKWTNHFRVILDELGFNDQPKIFLLAVARIFVIYLVGEDFLSKDSHLDKKDRDRQMFNEYIHSSGNQSSKLAIVDKRQPINQNKTFIKKVSFDEIGGQADAKREVMKLCSALKNPERYKKWGTKIPHGICMFGPPGNGKTLLVKALASACNVLFYNENFSKLLSKWYGESEKNINNLFERVKKEGGIIFFDEADALGSSRSDVQAHEITRRVVNILNINMDGLVDSDNIIVIFATNRLENMDEALLRAGRIDRWISVPVPDRKGRAEIFNIHMKKSEIAATRKLFKDLNIEEILNITENLSGADIAEIVRRTLEEKVILEEKGLKPDIVSTSDIILEIEKYERTEGKKERKQKKIGF